MFIISFLIKLSKYYSAKYYSAKPQVHFKHTVTTLY